MKATTQYEDFIGTAAADISDGFSLNEFIEEKGLDLEKFNAIGASFYSSYNDNFFATIICVDLEKSNNEKKHIVKIEFEKELTKDDFFNLFKRFNVIITGKHDGFHNHEIDEELVIDNKGEELDL